MKKVILFTMLLISCISLKAQDSCYVYTQLHWKPAATKYVAKIQLGEQNDDTDITDANGKKLAFYNIMHAMNYLSTQGWEFIQMLPPMNPTSPREQFIVIKKKMPIEDAKKYSTPKE